MAARINEPPLVFPKKDSLCNGRQGPWIPKVTLKTDDMALRQKIQRRTPSSVFEVTYGIHKKKQSGVPKALFFLGGITKCSSELLLIFKSSHVKNSYRQG
jgi:hypothetical protein